MYFWNPVQNFRIGMFRVVFWIGIFWSVLVGISWYLLYRYQWKSWSVSLFGGNPFFPQKGSNCPLFEEKGGTSSLFDTASPPLAEKRSSCQISNTDRKYQPPSKSDTGKIPIPKKLLVTPWYTTLVMLSLANHFVNSSRVSISNQVRFSSVQSTMCAAVSLWLQFEYLSSGSISPE